MLLTVLLEMEPSSPCYSTSFTWNWKSCEEYWRLLGTVVCHFSIFLPLAEPELT